MNPPDAARLIAGILLFLCPAAAQDRALIEAEQAREAGVPTLLAALSQGDARARIFAARAVGRLENPAYRDALVPLLDAPDPRVRRTAAGALAQMRTTWSTISSWIATTP